MLKAVTFQLHYILYLEQSLQINLAHDVMFVILINLIALQNHTLNSNAEWGCVIDRVILRVYQ